MDKIIDYRPLAIKKMKLVLKNRGKKNLYKYLEGVCSPALVSQYFCKTGGKMGMQKAYNILKALEGKE